MSDEDDRLRAKQREVERLESELAEVRVRGDPEEVAALEHELADLEVRGVEGIPIDQVLGGMIGRRPPATRTWSWRWTLVFVGLTAAGLLVVWLLTGEVQGIGLTAIALSLVIATIAIYGLARWRDRW